MSRRRTAVGRAAVVAVAGALWLAAGCGGQPSTGATGSDHSAAVTSGDEPSAAGSTTSGDTAGSAFDGELSALVTTDIPEEFAPSTMPEPINQTQAFDLDFYLANLTGNVPIPPTITPDSTVEQDKSGARKS